MLGEGWIRAVEIMNLGGFVFQVCPGKVSLKETLRVLEERKACTKVWREEGLLCIWK